MKIIELRSTNVKRLKAVSIRPDGSVVQITGPNDSGKSSVLDSIAYALGGKTLHPSQPIRQGEQKATVRLDMGEIIVTRRFTPSGTAIDVETPEGARYPSPQAFLDALLGKLSFDPLAFIRRTPPEQLEQLRRLVTVDVDIDAIDRTVALAYEERTAKNREVKSLRERVTLLAAAVHPEADTTPEDEEALVNQLAEAAGHNASVRQRWNDQARAEQLLAACDDEVARIKGEMTKLAQRLVEVEEDRYRRAIALTKAGQIPEPIDTAVLQVAIRDARAANAARETEARARAAYHAAANTLQAALSDSENLTDLIDESLATKRDAIARAAMPVPGLSFGEGEITFNGVPLAQASSAQQIQVATAIGMALNPKLRILCVRDGSLLDETSLRIIGELADQHDFQVWVERVDTTGKVGISMEDGSVVAIDGAPIEADEPALIEAGD